ncbi:MAG: phage portal protein [Thalassospira sp.]|uniref:phage portal protein n=1 Tax=Thalassospira sp. TaxID=1912094 RepID=UPI003A8ADB53
MTNPVTILGADGLPMKKSASTFAVPRSGGGGSVGGSLAGWSPRLRSADDRISSGRDRMVARVRDLVDRNGWLSGAVQRQVDEAIGASFRFNWNPDLNALGLDRDWAKEFVAATENAFHNYANDPRRPLDAGGRLSLAGILGLGFRHRMGEGDAICLAHWLPKRSVAYSTAVQVVDPDRLSNPYGKFNGEDLRNGIEINGYGAPIAYHFRSRHPNDPWSLNNQTWQRVKARTKWGRSRVIHFFEVEQAGQTRGRGLLGPAIEKLKVADDYERSEQEAALINAIFAAFIESPFDKTIMDEVSEDEGAISQYQSERSAFADANPVLFGGSKVHRLFAGESFNFNHGNRDNAAFQVFIQNALRHAATALGQSYEEFANDWSGTNYSSARAAMLKSWKFLTTRRGHFANGFATPIWALWLEEHISQGNIDLPSGTPRFWDNPAAWCRGNWIGPGRGWVDPVKEANASQIRMENNLSTLQTEAAEQGQDYREILDQRAREKDEFEERGLVYPGSGQTEVVYVEDQNGDTVNAHVSRLEDIGRRAQLRGK